jgi:hypothetical protein
LTKVKIHINIELLRDLKDSLGYYKDSLGYYKDIRVIYRIIFKNKFLKKIYIIEVYKKIHLCLDNQSDIAYDIEMKNSKPTFFLTASDSIAQENAVRQITLELVKNQGRAIKIFSCWEPLNQNLANLCSTSIGISPFSQEPYDKKMLRPLIEGYRKTMESLDPDWWADTLKTYIPKLQESLVDGVFYLLQECNDTKFLEVARSAGYTILRIKGKTKQTAAEEGFLSNESFKKYKNWDNVINLSCPNSSLIEEAEDANKAFSERIKTIFKLK